MSPLAFEIYAILRGRVLLGLSPVPRSELAGGLSSPFNTLDGDSPVLATALDEVATMCRATGLPSITAMVVTETAGAAQAELRAVRSSSYPPAL
jgi:hypothetical protein